MATRYLSNSRTDARPAGGVRAASAVGVAFVTSAAIAVPSAFGQPATEAQQQAVASEPEQIREAEVKPPEQRLAGLYERLLLLTPPEARDSVLIEMISDPVPEVVIAGLSLADRAISADRPLSPEVAHATLGRLEDANPRVRAPAAALLVRVASEDAQTALAKAFARESDPAVADVLLASVMRWPSHDAIERVAYWCVWPVRPSRQSFDAAYALFAAGMLSDGSTLSLIVDAARTQDSANAPLSALRLLVEAGSHADRAWVRSLLASDGRAVRSRAARALVADAASVNDLTRVLEGDPDLLPVVAEAVGRHGSSIDRVRSLSEAADRVGERSGRLREQIVELAARLDLPERVTFAVELASASHRAEDAVRVLDGLDELLPDPARERGLVLLAELLTGLGRTNDARAVTQSIDLPTADLITRGRVALVEQRLGVLEASAASEG